MKKTILFLALIISISGLVWTTRNEPGPSVDPEAGTTQVTCASEADEQIGAWSSLAREAKPGSALGQVYMLCDASAQTYYGVIEDRGTENERFFRVAESELTAEQIDLLFANPDRPVLMSWDESDAVSGLFLR